MQKMIENFCKITTLTIDKLRFNLDVNMTSQWANFFIECDPQSSTKSQDSQRFRKIEIYIHKIINSNNNINVYRTFNNNVIVHKTQNKLPEPNV